MWMKPDEIVHSYRMARSPGKQIRVLAELNDCSREEIRRILESEGVTVLSAAARKHTKRDEPYVVTEEDRTMMYLRKNGVSVAEIAKKTGHSKSTVFVRLKKLKERGIYKDGE